MTPKQIKNLRQCLELTQKQFAAMLGKSRWSVMRWESGRCPMDQTVERLLTVLIQGGSAL